MEEIKTKLSGESDVNIINRDDQFFIEIPITLKTINDICLNSKQLTKEEQLQNDLSISRNIQNEKGDNFSEKFNNYCEKNGVKSMRFYKELQEYRNACEKRKNSQEQLTKEDKDILDKLDDVKLIKEVDEIFENMLEDSSDATIQKKDEISFLKDMHEEKLVFDLNYYKDNNSFLKEKLESIKELIQ